MSWPDSQVCDLDPLTGQPARPVSQRLHYLRLHVPKYFKATLTTLLFCNSIFWFYFFKPFSDANKLKRDESWEQKKDYCFPSPLLKRDAVRMKIGSFSDRVGKWHLEIHFQPWQTPSRGIISRFVSKVRISCSVPIDLQNLYALVYIALNQLYQDRTLCTLQGCTSYFIPKEWWFFGLNSSFHKWRKNCRNFKLEYNEKSLIFCYYGHLCCYYGHLYIYIF